jgi:hypothetical protein
MAKRGAFSFLGGPGAAALLVLIAAPASAQPSDVAVKAAFLPKFGAYVAWPSAARPGAGESFELCVLGSDPFGRMIDEAARGQQVGGRPVQVRRLTGVAAAGGCHLAFVQGTAQSGTASMLQALQSKPVLTVTDERTGGQAGMIHFVIHQGRVRFTIDEAAAARSGLSINSRLLGIALSVKRAR